MRFLKPFSGDPPASVKKVSDDVLIKTGTDSRTVPRGIIRQIIKESKGKVDPYLSLSIAFQESGIDPMNPYHLNPDYFGTPFGGPKAGISSIQKQFQYAQTMQDKGIIPQGEDYFLQGYNGYGRINRGHADLEGANKIYGVDIPASGIDLKKTPLYGRRIQSIRDMLSKNQDIVNMVNETGDYLPLYKPKDTVRKYGGSIKPYM